MRHAIRHQSAGLKSQPPRYSFQTAAYEQLHLIYLLEGELFLETGDQIRRLTADTALLLREGGAFRLFTRSLAYHGVYYRCSGNREPLFRGPPAVFSGTPPMRALARLMQAEAREPAVGSRNILLGLGRALVWQAIQLTQPAADRDATELTRRQWAGKARRALDLSIYTNQGAREVLAGLKLSYRQIARHFQAEVGLSPKQYQLQARLREATELLRQTRSPVTTIALELGFASSQHFATQFAEHYGVSPSQYRARGAGSELTRQNQPWPRPRRHPARGLPDQASSH